MCSSRLRRAPRRRVGARVGCRVAGDDGVAVVVGVVDVDAAVGREVRRERDAEQPALAAGGDERAARRGRAWRTTRPSRMTRDLAALLDDEQPTRAVARVGQVERLRKPAPARREGDTQMRRRRLVGPTAWSRPRPSARLKLRCSGRELGAAACDSRWRRDEQPLAQRAAVEDAQSREREGSHGARMRLRSG